MSDFNDSHIEFKVWGRYALFADPLTKIGGEKFSYQIPTYEALKGIAKSIYWKPTLIWIIDEVRVMRRFRTQTKGIKPLEFSGGNTLAIYTFLADVEYQVRAHFEWNLYRPELARDRNPRKHGACVRKFLERGGRQDVFLGVRDCQGYVEPCESGSGVGEHDGAGRLDFALMFHGFDYPDETGKNELHARFWKPTMIDGVIRFDRDDPTIQRKFVREMTPKRFGVGRNLSTIETESTDWEV